MPLSTFNTGSLHGFHLDLGDIAGEEFERIQPDWSGRDFGVNPGNDTRNCCAVRGTLYATLRMPDCLTSSVRMG